MTQWGELFGVYSGRINKESDLGVVWRTEALREIIDGGRWAKPPED